MGQHPVSMEELIMIEEQGCRFRQYLVRRDHFLVIALVLIALLLSLSNVQAMIPQSKSELLQFVAAGHVLGFEEKGVYVASGNHMLKVEFAGAQGALPEAVGSHADGHGFGQSLHQVSYKKLWPGVDLVYEATSGGIMESTWHIAAGADPDQIRLRYNGPVAIEAGGDLKISYANGWMSESKPIAWQQIDGRRVPVQVAFRVVGSPGTGTTVGFALGQYSQTHPLMIDPVLGWNTFMGSADYDFANGIAVDDSGNVYVVGESYAWGTSPVNGHSGGNKRDVFVAMLNTFGVLQWHTFMGSSQESELASGIALDSDENVYLVGTSTYSWGTPVNAHAGGYETFVAKLDESGVLQWNTFMGSASGSDYGYGIVVDSSSNVYVTGSSPDTWGAPVTAHAGGSKSDAFVAKLNSAGVRQWNTFMGGAAADDSGRAIAKDTSDNIYVTGSSRATWGTPVNDYTGTWEDVFVAKLGGNGTLVWNTFMGSSDSDTGKAITVDSKGNVYVVGESSATWGTPLTAHSGGPRDAFAAKLNGSGVLQWHTFMGSADYNEGNGVAVDCMETLYVAGSSKGSWGTPWNGHAGDQEDAFVAKIDTNGEMLWNTFMGAGTDYGRAVAVDAGNVYVAGSSSATWGTPVSPHTGLSDALVFKLTATPPEEATGWVVSQISNSSNGGGEPVLSDTHVAWTRWVDTNNEVFLYNGISVSQFTNNSVNEQNLFASEKYIAWNWRDPVAGDDIFLYDGTTASQLTAAGYNYRPKIHGERMVWEVSGGIVLYDISSGSKRSLSGMDPWINGNWVSLTLRELGFDYAYVYDISTQTYQKLGIGRSTRVNDDYVAYHYYDGDNNQVMLHKRASSVTSQLTESGTSQMDINLDGNHLLWVRSSGDSRTLNDYLLFHDIATATTKVIATNVGMYDYVSMDGNLIVYAGYDGNDFEIFIYEIDSGITRQLTNNDYSDRDPRVRGQRIAWTQSDAKEDEVVMLATRSSASPWILFMPAILTGAAAGN